MEYHIGIRGNNIEWRDTFSRVRGALRTDPSTKYCNTMRSARFCVKLARDIDVLFTFTKIQDREEESGYCLLDPKVNKKKLLYISSPRQLKFYFILFYLYLLLMDQVDAAMGLKIEC